MLLSAPTSTGRHDMKLNLGCGQHKIDGFVNVDRFQTPAVDQIFDLETVPWPWPDGSAEQVVLNHVLEHLGNTTDSYLNIIKELWRVCAHDAQVHIVAPHPRHDFHMWDPTHVRPITWEGLALFDQEQNRQWIASGDARTPLGVMIDVDFRIESIQIGLDEPWATRQREGTIAPEELDYACRHLFNVIAEQRIVLRARKA
jgi:hypothetical protein